MVDIMLAGMTSVTLLAAIVGFAYAIVIIIGGLASLTFRKVWWALTTKTVYDAMTDTYSDVPRWGK